MAGPYTTPNIYVNVSAVFTNTVPVDAYRGAGRPEATFQLERVIDKAAREMGIDPVEIRRRNFIQPDQYPYQTPVAVAVRQRQLHRHARQGAGAVGLCRLRRAPRRERGPRQAARHRALHLDRGLRHRALAPRGPARRPGRPLRERDGAGERHRLDLGVHRLAQPRPGPRDHLPAGDREHARHRREADRHRARRHRAHPVRHGHLRLALDRGRRRPRCSGATEKIIAKAKKIAAHLMEAAEGDVELQGRQVHRRRHRQVGGLDRRDARGLRAAQLPARPDRARAGGDRLLRSGELHLSRRAPTSARSRSTPTPARSRWSGFTCADDFGNVINPMIVEGQVHGGVAQGIGQALLENTVYDANGQLQTGSYMDYAMPRADDLPSFVVDASCVTPCTHNPLGVKGCGEAGAIGSPPALVNAVIDALQSGGHDVKHIDMPLSPARVWAAIEPPGDNLGPASPAAPARAATGRSGGTADVRIRFRQARHPRRGGGGAGRRGRAGARRRPDPDPDAEAAARQPLGAGQPERHRRDQGRRRTGRRRCCASAAARPTASIAREAAARFPGLAGHGEPDRRPGGPQPRHDRRQPRQQRSLGLLSGGGARARARPS